MHNKHSIKKLQIKVIKKEEELKFTYHKSNLSLVSFKILFGLKVISPADRTGSGCTCADKELSANLSPVNRMYTIQVKGLKSYNTTF